MLGNDTEAAYPRQLTRSERRDLVPGRESGENYCDGGTPKRSLMAVRYDLLNGISRKVSGAHRNHRWY